MGIDPGSLVTGYGIIKTEGNRIKLLDAGPIRLKKLGEIQARLHHLHDFLEERIKAFSPQVMSIEKIFHGVNFKSVLLLGYVRGVALMLAGRHGLEVAEYAPTQVKKTVTGYGGADKVQVSEMVRILLSLREPPKPHDVADALALAICHMNHTPVQHNYGR